MINPFLPRSGSSRTRLVTGLLGLCFLVAMACTGRADDPPERLTPEQRKDLERQASELFQAGFRSYQRGDLGAAVEKTRQSLQIRERIYPQGELPQGHPELAETLHAMGFLLKAQGDYGGARGYYQQALAMREALYPKETYPQGHTELAQSLNNLGTLLLAQGDYGGRGGIFHGRWR